MEIILECEKVSQISDVNTATSVIYFLCILMLFSMFQTVFIDQLNSENFGRIELFVEKLVSQRKWLEFLDFL